MWLWLHGYTGRTERYAQPVRQEGFSHHEGAVLSREGQAPSVPGGELPAGVTHRQQPELEAPGSWPLAHRQQPELEAATLDRLRAELTRGAEPARMRTAYQLAALSRSSSSPNAAAAAVEAVSYTHLTLPTILLV